ncbi:MAG: hypothetical protein ACRCZ9_05820 [Fusobacteriaceae bacterium]
MDKETAKVAMWLDFFKYSLNKIFWLAITSVLCLTLYKIILSLSGKSTIADIGIKLLADLKFIASISWGVIASGLYAREKNAKEKVIKEKSKQIESLQKIIDSKRETSGLAETGCTNKKDL